MPRVTRQCIESIKARVNIQDVVERVVKLKRAGKSWVGLSPFSNEKSPSFYVHPEKGFYKCFSSGKAGDIFRFVEETEKVDFTEAIELIAERFNITLEYESGGQAAPQNRSLKRELLELHEYAADHYHRVFLGEPGAPIRTYWVEGRRFGLEVARDYKIGYAPPEASGLIEVLTQKGFSREALAKCGLFYIREGETAPEPKFLRPRFRGRLMIPIRDPQGQVIAFTARQLAQTPEDDPTHQAKYVNSPETPIFHKGSMLFNLDRAQAAVKEEGRFTLVEGQLDAIRCWSTGLKATVAPQGTGVTVDQLRILRRHCVHLDVFLDGDRAGREAALRILPLALQVGLELRVIPLPGGAKIDPDTFLLEQGLPGVARAREDAYTAMEFAVQALLPDPDPSPRAKADAAQRLYEILGECDSQVARTAYLEEAVRLLGVRPEAARADLDRYLGHRQRAQARAAPPPAAPVEPGARKPLTSSERTLLCLALQNHGLLEPLAACHAEMEIEVGGVEGRLLARLLADVGEGAWIDATTFESRLESAEERDAYYAALAEDLKVVDPVQAANQCVTQLHRRKLKNAMERLERRLPQVPAQAPELRTLLGEHAALKQAHLRPKTFLSGSLDA